MRPQDHQVSRHSPNPCRDDQSVITKLDHITEGDVYCLRDDLLGNPFNGSKHRKYKGLFDYFLDLKPSCIHIPASIASNHLVLSIEYCLKSNLNFKVYTKKPFGQLRPNARCVLNMTPHDALIYSDSPWQDARQAQELDAKSVLMPLGGYSQQAAVSSLSLGHDIMAFNELNALDTVILDAGTGLQAASALVAMQQRGYKNKAYVIAMGHLDFDAVLKDICLWTNLEKPTFDIEVIRPSTGWRYGSWNKTLDDYSREFFKNTGIILDPVYNAKSFYTMEKLVKDNKTGKSCLIVHSGGTYGSYTGTISE